MYRRTVLVVDDNEINRMILGKFLSDEYEVMYACNGQEALECLKENAENISAMLLDIIMPVMNGYEVLENMQKDAELSRIPVIVSSQKEGENDEVKALALGAQDYIAKPYKADIIRHRLTNIIKLRETAAMVNKAERDELTGIYNKQVFIQKVQQYLTENNKEKFDIICLGIEHFKLVNDTYGINGGDKVLHYIGKIMQDLCSKTKICGRFESDAFYGFIPHHDEYINDMFEPWEKRVAEYPIEMDIKIHCGIYQITDNQMDVPVMCDRAKIAADANRGKYDEYFYLYDESLREKMIEEQFIISHMQTALERKEFIVYYQPKYDLSTELVAGAEALVRWIHPEKGFMSPGAFIPIFEKNGFITQLDEYVWETACADIRSWMDKGYAPVAVSVNVSRADIYNPKLVDILLGLVAKYKIPIKYLHLEITESAYTENPKQIIAVVGKLRDLGFSIEMDDFGSGYSSLNMLADMPVDVLKLDMGFIQAETRHTSGKGILSFVISLAKWLDLAVVAEGVETKEQIVALRSMDCNYVQGYYYSKPIEKKAFEDLIKDARVTDMVCTRKTAVQYIKEKKKENRNHGDMVMMIVDDIAINRASLAATFMDDYEIVEKENGRQAWDYITENYNKIGIIMLDLLMPVMDGFQLLAKIRGDERTENLPVIVTSQGDTDTERRVLEMNANDFISKPYNPEIIRHRVENVVEGYEYRRIKNGTVDDLNVQSVPKKIASASDEELFKDIEKRKEYFDIVRVVDPRDTIVYENSENLDCDITSCFSVWGKTARCNNCTSLKAYEDKTTLCKFEHTNGELFFVISQYVQFGSEKAVVEMVKKLDTGYVESILDSEVLFANMDELNKQVEIDELTGVYNRKHLDEYLKNYVGCARMQGKDIGISKVDVDHFRNINETYGEDVGNEVLKAIAQILESNIALSKGDFVARYDQDEFLIVCLNIPQDIFMKRIHAVSELVKYIEFDSGERLHIGISAGCVNFSEFPNKNAKELIEIADNRLYEAKRRGRNCVINTGLSDDDSKTMATLYQGLIEKSSVSVVAVSKGTRCVLFANNAWKKQEGIPFDKDVVGARLDSLIPLDKLFLTDDEIDEMLYDSYVTSHRLSSLNHALNVQSRAIKWKGVDAYVCYAVDESELWDNAFLLDLALKNAKVMAWKYDFEHDRVTNTGTFGNIYKLKKVIENVLEISINSGFIHKDDADEYRRLHNQANKGKTVSGRVRMLDVSRKKYLWHQITYTPLAEEGAYGKESIGTAIDISEHVRQEESYLQQIHAMSDTNDKNIISIGQYNLSKNSIISVKNEKEYAVKITEDVTYDDLVGEYVEVASEEYKKGVGDFLNREKLLSDFNKNIREGRMRCHRLKGLGTRWGKLVYKLIAEPSTGDIIMFLYTYDDSDWAIDQMVLSKLCGMEYEGVGMLDVQSGMYKLRSVNTVLEQPAIVGSGAYDTRVLARLMKTLAGDDKDEVIAKFYLENIIHELENSDKYFINYAVKDDSDNIRYKKMMFCYLDNDKTIILYIRVDITDVYYKEQEQLKITRKALEQVKASNELKSKFMSRMSHDIRTPMNSILNLTRMVQEELDDKEAAMEDLKKIDTANSFLLGLVNDVLDMSRIEQGKIELYPQRYSYKEFIEYLESTFSEMAKQKNVELNVIKVEESYDVLIDRIRFNQICFNIVSNAIKYTPEGGQVTFSMIHKEIMNGVIPCDIYITDNGIGMSKEFQQKMFEPFEQEGRAFRTVEGTGLGLSIVKEIVDIMDGTIEVDSEIGKGTSFHIHLDMVLAEDTVEEINEETVDMDKMIGKHILIVEDHNLNQEIARRLLEKTGAIVKIVDNGLIALNEFEKNADYYDVILMDMRMPVMDGMTATKRIRELDIPKASTIPIIAMTANALYEEVQSALDIGVTAYLSKPIDVKKLYEIISKYI